MGGRIKLLPALQEEQAQAADPQIHAAVSASAGSGKTQVLTARVLRLLLGGAEPETILCLTFTRAGSAEMANRIGSRLAAWVRMRDADLRKDLASLGERNDPVTMQRARRLFAKVLDAPGGLRIQTIHSFAQALLAAFPAEAGIVPGFQPIEGRAEQELARTTLANLVAAAESGGNTQLISDLECLSVRLGEEGAVGYLKLCAAQPEAMAALGPADGIEAKLCRLMDLPDESIEEFIAHSCHDDRFDCDLLGAIADANRRWGAQTGLGHAELIEKWLALTPIERAAALPQLRKVVLTEKDTLKVSAGQAKAEPHYEAHAGRLAVLIGELLRIQNGARLAADMAAGLRAGQSFAESYTRAKRSAGVADFNDLITWTRRLLAAPGMGDWVRHKLDRRTDHILVDEAQDTNRAQWEIIEALAGEYFSGSSEAEERHRTIFMVGDFKQAIFGFQGTNPEEFNRARRWVRENSASLLTAEDEADDLRRLALEFKDLSISASYRSAPAVLEAVDAVIGEVGHRAMGMEEEPNLHRAHFSTRPGLVELWAPFEVPDDEDEDAGEERWLDERERHYAGALARQVRDWIEEAPVLASTGRPLSPGDILILVRSRGELASLIVARLFAEGVPVAGIDRLHLHKPLAVRDLLAAIAFAVQPLDDLNMANLLVSPLIGWSQKQLFDLAHNRESSLWRAIRDRSGEREDFEAAHQALSGLLGMADYTTPAQFLETILSGPMQGRRKIYGRLGPSARDPVDELLSSALEFERNEVASLDRFLAWFARGEVEIKRDPGEAGGTVRVMTVHGAKGLEAPVVVLADSTADPARLGGPSRTLDFPIEDQKAPLIRPRKKERVSPFEELILLEEQRDREEHWRLLYVGLTRAIERLVIAGIQPKGERAEDCWHTRVERALLGLGATWEPDEHWAQTMRYRGSVPIGPIRVKPSPVALAAPALPDWARSPAPVEQRPPRPLAPSALAEDRESAPPPSDAQRAAAQRGTLVHRLFERLADVPAATRREAALRWLERSAGLSDAAMRDEIVSTVCEVLDHPDFAPLFGEGSLAEAPLAAALPDGRVIAGTVDRLLVEPGRVSVVDFKTGRVPESAERIPAPHRAQMQAYAEALRVIFPDREIQSALLYTGGPKLFSLDG